jgi:hypothetical protein
VNLAMSEFYAVMPAKAGTQGPGAATAALDPRFRDAFAGVTGNVLI